MTSLHSYFQEDNLPEEKHLPSYKCFVTGEPIYKGVRIDRSVYFCIEVYESYDWVQWYKDNAGVSDREIYELSVEHFVDDGLANTLAEINQIKTA